MQRDLDFDEAAAVELIELFSRKGMVKILKCLDVMDSCRFNQLDDDVKTISTKTLNRQLKRLREDGFVTKETYAEVPPKTIYVLTEKGEELLDCVDHIEACASNWSDGDA